MPGTLPAYQLQPYGRHAMQFTRPDDGAPLLDLAPPYQRGRVWTPEQRVNLIRSLQMGLPIGAVLTSFRGWETTDGTYAVVDGRQRIETLRAWAAGDLRVPADFFNDDNIQQVAEDGTVSSADLTARGTRNWQRWPVNELQASGLSLAEEANLYLLINFGGTPQTDADRLRAATVASRG
ncbi:DUF262 domain-containing protein [Euzebya pacifica]|nr:DUF262 domain-containing protein [Euzebya pacifica]